MSTGIWVVVAAVVVALVLGTWRLLTDGRFRGTRTLAERRGPAEDPIGSLSPRIGAAVPSASFGERATLVQFSSAFCAPCRATRRTLAGVAEAVPGVTHVEIDAERHLELVRELGILRTPTTIVLDRAGREVTRASGAPRTEQVLAAIGGA